jgi:hypothetical protein
MPQDAIATEGILKTGGQLPAIGGQLEPPNDPVRSFLISTH